jgi:hypothetical protein
MRRIFAYRVYFTCDPEIYYVVGACNVRRAIRRAKQSWRAFAVIRKNRRLSVCKVERLYKGAVVRELKPGPDGRSIQPGQLLSSDKVRPFLRLQKFSGMNNRRPRPGTDLSY